LPARYADQNELDSWAASLTAIASFTRLTQGFKKLVVMIYKSLFEGLNDLHIFAWNKISKV
jgi:hypothetical protein